MDVSIRQAFVFISLFALSLASCTRTAKESTNVEFTLPTNKSIVSTKKITEKLNGKNTLRTLEIPGYANLVHVVINVQGPGLPGTILCGYNVEKETSYGPCDFASFPNVKIEVQSGNDRLFQVALAFASADSGGMSLNYGDAVRTLAAGNTTQVDIPMRELSQNSEEGRLKGRYLTGPNEGPTGILEVKVKPEEGRPSLTIMKTEIFSGWFEVFSMSGLKFEYVVNGNQTLFNQAVEKSFFSDLAATSAQVQLITGGDGYEVFGFFGDPQSIAQKIASASSCTATTVYESCISMDTRFFGPFRSTGNEGSFLELNANSMSWSLLPGAANFITDFRVLYNPNASPDNNPEFKKRFFSDEDLKDCNYLESFPGTEVLGRSIPVSQNNFSTQFPVFPETALIALCPRLGPVSYQSVLTFPDHSRHNNENDQSPYLRLEISGTNGSDPVLTLGTCQSAELKLYRSTGQNSAEFYYALGTVTLSNIENPNSGPAWLEFYTESTCSNRFTGDVTIDSGNSVHTNALYVKSILPGTGLAINPTLQSSNSSEIINAIPQYNTFSVNQPMLVARGPQRMIVTSGAPPSNQQMCYQILVSRVSASGFELNSGQPSLDVNFNLNGDYTAYHSASDCENDSGGFGTGPVAIGANQSKMEIFLKRTNATTSDLPVVFSATDYQPVSQPILGSNGSKSGARFVISQVGSHEVGKCNTIKISHVNSNNDEVPVSEPFMEFPLKTESQIKLTENSYCDTSSNFLNTVTFLKGEHTRFLYYFGYSNISHTVAMTNGALPGQSGSISITLPPDTQQPHLNIMLPQIKSPILGSHDFPKTIVLNPSPGATVQCFQANQPYSWDGFNSPCPSFDSGTNIFTWTAAQASQASMKGFRFRVSNGNRFGDYFFVPERIYSFNRSGISIPFDVKNCDVTLNSNNSTGWNDINGDGSTVLCLRPGMFSGGTAAAKVLGANKFLIGATDANGDPASAMAAPSGLPSISIIAAGATPGVSIANIGFVPAGSGTIQPLLNFPASGSGTVRSINNSFATSSYHPYGILKNNAASALISVLDRFNIDGRTNPAYGVQIYMVSSGADNSKVVNPSFSLQSNVGGNYARGINIYQSLANLDLSGVQIDPAFNNGSLIETEQVAQSSVINLRDSNLSFAGSANGNRFPIWLGDGVTTLNMNNVRIASNLAESILKAIATNASDLDISISNSRLISEQDVPAVFIVSGQTQTLDLKDTHFIRRLAAGTTSSAIYGATGHSINTPVTYSPQGVLFCGSNAGTQWNTVFSFTPAAGSTLALPSVTTNYNTASESCY